MGAFTNLIKLGSLLSIQVLVCACGSRASSNHPDSVALYEGPPNFIYSAAEGGTIRGIDTQTRMTPLEVLAFDVSLDPINRNAAQLSLAKSHCLETSSVRTEPFKTAEVAFSHSGSGPLKMSTVYDQLNMMSMVAIQGTDLPTDVTDGKYINDPDIVFSREISCFPIGAA